jgi:hypothetical protein
MVEYITMGVCGLNGRKIIRVTYYLSPNGNTTNVAVTEADKNAEDAIRNKKMAWKPNFRFCQFLREGRPVRF